MKKNDKYSDIYTYHLMLLISSDKYDILELFLKNGFDVNRTLYFDGKEHNLLFYISERIHGEPRFSIETLLKYGINIKSKLEFNIDYQYRVRSIFEFLEETSSSKKNSILDILIDRYINYDSEYHYKMLFVIFNYYSNIKADILLLREAIENLNEYSFRILADDDNIEIVILFIYFCYFNEDEFFESNFYKNILNYMRSYETIDTIELIYESFQNILRNKENCYHFNRFCKLIKEKKYFKVKDILDSQLDINYKDPNTSKTPLMVASQYGINDKNIFDILMKYYPNKDLLDNTESTALHIACKYNNSEIIPYLITEKNINMKDVNGQTPLMIAIKEKNYECIMILLSDDCNKYNVDVNIKDNNGNFPLVDISIKFKNSKELEELIDLLIKKGADKDEVNHDKLTALHIVCKYDDNKLIPKLITNNNINMKDINGKTPIMIACNEQKIQCIIKLMTNELFIKNYKVNNNNNELNILLLLLEHKIENDKVYEELMKWELYFGLKQVKKKINIIVNNKSFIRLIIKNGFYIHKGNKCEKINTPLIFSIVNNIKDLTKGILNCYDKTIHETDENNKYCLFYAIDNKDEEYFDLLMKSKKLILKRIMVKEKQH